MEEGEEREGGGKGKSIAGTREGEYVMEEGQEEENEEKKEK